MLHNRTKFCHQQAAECAAAATHTALPEVREAYLNIAQAWLQLAPDVASNQPIPERPSPEERTDTHEADQG